MIVVVLIIEVWWEGIFLLRNFCFLSKGYRGGRNNWNNNNSRAGFNSGGNRWNNSRGGGFRGEFHFRKL
jgi:hypothetical protein